MNEKKNSKFEKTSGNAENQRTTSQTHIKKIRTAFTIKKSKKCDNSEVLGSPNQHSMDVEEYSELEDENLLENEYFDPDAEELLDFEVGGEIRKQSR